MVIFSTIFKRPFLSFFVMLCVLIGSLLFFIQSALFAQWIKAVGFRFLPHPIGIEGEFSEISIGLLPPRVSIKKPRIFFGARNIAHIPPGSSIIADQVDLNFRFFQMLSGHVHINELKLLNGQIHVALDVLGFEKKKKIAQSAKNLSFQFPWDDLLDIQADAILLQNMEVLFEKESGESQLRGKVNFFKFSQSIRKDRAGYLISFSINGLEGKALKNFYPLPIFSTIESSFFMNALDFTLDSFSLSTSHLNVKSKGQLKGSLFNSKVLEGVFPIEIAGNLEEVRHFFPSLFSFLNVKDHIAGAFTAKGVVSGDFKDLPKSLKVVGKCDFQKFSYEKDLKKWNADTIQTELAWDFATRELLFTKGVFTRSLKERTNGDSPGDGGKIEIGPVKWKVDSLSPFEVPFHMEHAHLHWLAFTVMPSVYSLDFRLNGGGCLTFIPANKLQDWGMKVTLDNELEQFQFDNQKYQQKKRLNRIFKIPKIGLKAKLRASSQGVFFDEVFLRLPHTQIRVYGKIDQKKGYDLHASTNAVYLQDLQEIAEQDIRGAGKLNIYVHGFSKRVWIEMDLHLKNVAYLNLDLGKIDGKLIWDDGPSHLLFQSVVLNQGLTQGSIEGGLYFDSRDSPGRIDLQVSFNRGNVHDLIQIFSKLTSPLAWFPHALRGSFQGSIKVSGEVQIDLFKVDAKIEGVQWHFMGEHFAHVLLEGGYRFGDFLIQKFRAIKRKGVLFGDILYTASKKWNWNFHTENLSLEDFDQVAQLDTPFRGALFFKTSGEISNKILDKSPENEIESETQLSLVDLSVRGRHFPASKLDLKVKGGLAQLYLKLLGNQAVVQSFYDFNFKRLSRIRCVLNDFDFTPFLFLLNHKMSEDRKVLGRMSGNLDLTFHAGKIEAANGTFSLSDFRIEKEGVSFKMQNPLYLKISQGDFSLYEQILKSQSYFVLIQLRAKDRILSGQINGEIDASFFEFLFSPLMEANGKVSFSLGISGDLKNPIFLGKIKLNGNFMKIVSVEFPFENIMGDFQVKENVLLVEKVDADFGGGKVSLKGRVSAHGSDYPSIFLNGAIVGSKIKIYPFQYLRVKGDLGIRGMEPPYVVNGKLLVDSALCRTKFMGKKNTSEGIKTLPYAPLFKEKADASLSKLKLNIGITASKRVIIDNDLFKNTQLKGSLSVVNTLESPQLLGHLEVLHGSLIFKKHSFQIQSATMQFDNPAAINPSFDFNSNTEINGIKIKMYASGTLDQIKVEFTSNPAMQESDILSLLTIGLTNYDLQKLNASDLNAIQQGEAASLVLHSLDFNRELEEKTGFQVQLDESMNNRHGTSAFRPLSQSDASAGPQITIRRQITPRVSLSAGSTVGAGTNKSNQLNMDYSVNQNFSITGVYSNYGNSSATDIQSSTQASQNSYGLDLRFQKRFK